MKTKEYLFKQIVGDVIYYNDYWGDTLPESELTNNTEEAVDTLISYCTLLSKNKNCVFNDFMSNTLAVREIVKAILGIILADYQIVRKRPDLPDSYKTNGETCWIDSNGNKHHVHAQDNGYLYIENDPQKVAYRLLADLSDLQEVINSDKHTTSLNKYLHKWYDFPGYEDGSSYVYISAINYVNEHYVFTGTEVFFTTENNHGDGVLVNDVEDYDFENLPYTEELETVEELIDILDNNDVVTLEDIKQDVINTMNEYWFDNKICSYDNK